jgi:hypothetical protein
MAKGIRVTVVDLENGDSATQDVAAGDYLAICVEPCWLDSTQAYDASGTHVLTIKGRKSKDGG